jgi:hypothetical protein
LPHREVTRDGTCRAPHIAAVIDVQWFDEQPIEWLHEQEVTFNTSPQKSDGPNDTLSEFRENISKKPRSIYHSVVGLDKNARWWTHDREIHDWKWRRNPRQNTKSDKRSIEVAEPRKMDHVGQWNRDPETWRPKPVVLEQLHLIKNHEGNGIWAQSQLKMNGEVMNGVKQGYSGPRVWSIGWAALLLDPPYDIPIMNFRESRIRVARRDMAHCCENGGIRS